MQVQMRIKGYLVGNIWMPNTECYKPLDYSMDEANRRWGEKGTLRDHVLRATNDGDFQSCAIAEGFIEATVTRRTGNGYSKRVRYFELDRFPSIADCTKDDWCGPNCEGE